MMVRDWLAPTSVLCLALISLQCSSPPPADPPPDWSQLRKSSEKWVFPGDKTTFVTSEELLFKFTPSDQDTCDYLAFAIFSTNVRRTLLSGDTYRVIARADEAISRSGPDAVTCDLGVELVNEYLNLNLFRKAHDLVKRLSHAGGNPEIPC